MNWVDHFTVSVRAEEKRYKTVVVCIGVSACVHVASNGSTQHFCLFAFLYIYIWPYLREKGTTYLKFPQYKVEYVKQLPRTNRCKEVLILCSKQCQRQLCGLLVLSLIYALCTPLRGTPLVWNALAASVVPAFCCVSVSLTVFVTLKVLKK